MLNKKIIIATIGFALIIAIGLVQINIINTKALSPIGTGEDNYELVKEEFGADFEEFIKDDASIKIYKSNDENKDTTIRINDKEFRVDKENPIVEKVFAIGNSISGGFNSIKDKIEGKLKEKKDTSNNKNENYENETSNENNNSQNEKSKEQDSKKENLENKEPQSEALENKELQKEDFKKDSKDKTKSNDSQNKKANTELDSIVDDFLNNKNSNTEKKEWVNPAE